MNREYLIFKNPTSEEFQELIYFVDNEVGDYLIRFIIDEDNILYTWGGYLMHDTFVKQILKTEYSSSFADGSYNIDSEKWRLNAYEGNLEWDELFGILSSTKMGVDNLYNVLGARN